MMFPNIKDFTLLYIHIYVHKKGNKFEIVILKRQNGITLNTLIRFVINY